MFPWDNADLSLCQYLTALVHPLASNHLTRQLANHFPYHSAPLIKLPCSSREDGAWFPEICPEERRLEPPSRRRADPLGSWEGQVLSNLPFGLNKQGCWRGRRAGGHAGSAGRAEQHRMGELNWLPLGRELSKRISGEKGREKEGVRCNAIETKGSFNPP